ncbi:MAG: redoxin domain-containing protein [SAR86 cluster bacterium]|nr:redoxin domain-containing protein [SAR86 cluster bacterium]MDG2347527.1 redoxin domain-containing protein [SAR86 cluster bacterium]
MNYLFNLLAFCFLASISYAAEIKLQNPSTNFQAPNFSTTNSFGETIQLSDFIGQPVILEWTNHECPYVARHYNENNMQAVQKIARDNDVVWLSIISSTPGDQGHVTPSKANELTVSRGALPSHVLIDESGEVGMLYGAKTTPHMFMIDAAGVLRYKGAIDDIGRGMQFFDASFAKAKNYVSSQLPELIAQKSLSADSTVAYGCSVKYNYD